MSKDYPFNEVVSKAQTLVEAGATLFQKFSCANCGERLTMENPNAFYIEGTCDKCSHVTNIKEQGCNYLIVLK